MSIEQIILLIQFAFVSSITPGPNNLMLMASGTNFGFRRTVPHLLGVALGFVFMCAMIGVGLVQVFQTYPVSRTILKVISVFYLGWLAWKIANAAPPREGEAAGKPFTFWQAVAFQWVNVKAWMMALSALTVYAPDNSLKSVLWVATVFGMVNLPSVTSWVILGQQFRRILTNNRRLRIFNFTMAGLLILSLYPVVFSGDIPLEPLPGLH